ncbi:MAG: ABC transporter permease [Gaiellaceae bacterium]
MTAGRIFVVGGVLSYRALFNWMRPFVYVPTMLGSPLFQILFFAYIGRASGVESDAFFVVGNAVQVSAMAGIFGVAMTVGGERWTQTLSLVLVSPADRFALFLGRALPLIVNGFILSSFGFVVGLALLDFELEPSVVPALAACVLVTTASCTAFGFIIGSVGLYAREIFVAANLAYIGLLLFCGVNVPLEELPPWMRAISEVLPLTHGIEAARLVADGASLGSVDGLILREVLAGAGYAVAAYVLFRTFEAAGRRTASFDNY